MAYTFDDWKSGAKPPKGWDGADAVDDGWTGDEIDAFMRATVRPWTPPAHEQRRADPPAAKPRPVNAPAKQVTTREARTVEQTKPETATVTDLHTRRTVRADDSWQIQLVCGEKGVKPGVTKNWSLFLENHPDTAGLYAWDAFKLRVMLMRRPPWDKGSGEWTPRVLQERDYSETVMWLEALHMTPKASNIAPVIQTIAERSSFDRLREYLEGLKWDGTPRVVRFANDYLGVKGDNYARTVSEKWLVASAARGLKPGCKADNMAILEGPQGLQKSMAVKTLYGAEFYTDNLSDILSKDAMMELQGVWGLEVAEMQRFSNAETNAVKKFLSREIDRYRPPYGRTVIEAKRRCIMVGTINPEGNAYLRDPTGARRFWPLECGRIDIDKIARDRDQLWAEAVHMFKAGVNWWVERDEQTVVEIEQEKRTDVDAWMTYVAPLTKGATTITQSEIFEKLGIARKDVDHRHAGRVGRIMKKLGWSMARERSDNEDKIVFRAPGFTPKREAKDDDLLEW